MSARNGGGPDFSILGDFSDTELLAIVDDLADENGWATTYDVRQQLGAPGGLQPVGQRLAWMRRYGWLERGERVKVQSSWSAHGWEWTASWRLTAIGHALLDHPELSRSMQNALAKLSSAQRLRLTRELGEIGWGSVPEVQAALRRQWRRSMRLR